MSDMKIKLVTFFPHPNFGTCLQSYALNKVLRDMGYEVEFIYNEREVPPITFKGYIRGIIKKTVSLFLSSNLKDRIKAWRKNFGNGSEEQPPVVLELPNHRLLNILYQITFIKNYLLRKKYFNLQWRKVYKFSFLDGNYTTRRIFTYKQYKEVTEDADLFITGSDQIWNPYCGGFNPMMFLEFAGKKKRIAYSSSISRPCFPKSVEQRAKEDLSKFSHIAVREQSSVDYLKQLLNRKDIKLVVDPTCLLSAQEWEDFGNRRTIEFEVPDKYIFCYFVGEVRKDFYEEMVQTVKRKTGIENVITLDCYNRPLNYGNGRLYLDAGPYEWVYLLQHASYICADSFHATVFALKFGKEFVHALKNDDKGIESQNTRMYDLLGRYGLKYKLYKPDSDEWQTPIDLDRVHKMMDVEIADSMKYLKWEIEN